MRPMPPTRPRSLSSRPNARLVRRDRDRARRLLWSATHVLRVNNQGSGTDLPADIDRHVLARGVREGVRLPSSGGGPRSTQRLIIERGVARRLYLFVFLLGFSRVTSTSSLPCASRETRARSPHPRPHHRRQDAPRHRPHPQIHRARPPPTSWRCTTLSSPDMSAIDTIVSEDIWQPENC